MNQGSQSDDAIGRSAMSKAMWRIVPLILLGYMVAYIDRVNVSFASLQMNDDLKFSARSLDTTQVGSLVSLGGGLGVVCIFIAGWNSDRHGDRLRDAFVLTIVIAAALLLLGVAATPALAIVGYLLFSATFFTAGMLLVSSWADLLPVRQLAVGSAAINTLWQIGAFLSPYAWGVTKDATGSFRAALIGASVVVVVEALVILYVRTRVMSERRERVAALEQRLAHQ